MDIDEPVQTVLPDLSLSERRFLLSLPETENKDHLKQDIKNAVLKDSTLANEKREERLKQEEE